MSQAFRQGDFLIFQLEAGFALLRLLDIEETGDNRIWHVSAYEDLFPDIDTAEAASACPGSLKRGNDHIPLTNRAFESTQVARISNLPLTETETAELIRWKADPDREVSDRSVRLMLGLR
ncbi:MAG: hypothetical protein WBO10_08985 [Pyrinomonadaceae bacterium]